MEPKKLIIAAVVGLLVVPAFASAYTYKTGDYDRQTETLVEGHTVFAVVQATICIDTSTDESKDCPGGENKDFDISYDVRANLTMQRMGAAVAVLVRDRVKEVSPAPVSPTCATNRDIVATIFYENPGVLWFNDQFLVGDDLDLVEADVDANADVCTKKSVIDFNANAQNWRYPCGGWVWATQSGNPDPRTFTSWAYQESYVVTDPNDKVWTIDKFSLAPIGVGPLPAVDQMQDLGLDDDVGPYPYAYDGDDLADGDLRAVFGPAPTNGAPVQYYLGAFNAWIVPLQGTGACMKPGELDVGPTSGQSSAPYTDTAGRSPAYDTHYVDPDAAGPKHLESVKYNAVLFFFFEDLVPKGVKVHGKDAPDDGDLSYCQAGTDEWDCGVGRTDDSEGNSHPYNDQSTNSGEQHIHPTSQVDLYFHNALPPTIPGARKYAVYDTTGSSAPRHAHPADPTGFDDRMRTSVCGDADWQDSHSTYTYNGGGTWTGSTTGTDQNAARYGEGSGPTGPWTPNDSDCTGGYGGGTTGSLPEYY